MPEFMPSRRPRTAPRRDSLRQRTAQRADLERRVRQVAATMRSLRSRSRPTTGR
jgi:hypothetical protein